MPIHVVVMGVSGSGKTTVAREVARRLGWPMVDGDDLHPAENVAKMAAGTALDEEDRRPWLARLVDWTSAQHAAGHSTMLVCSALTRRSRDVLRSAADGTAFIHLTAAAPLLAARMSRRDHFMPPALLASQLQTLEPLAPDEVGAVVEVGSPLDAVVRTTVEAIRRLGGGGTP